MNNDPLTNILLERNAALDQCDRLRKQIKRMKQSHKKAQESFVDDLRKIIKEKAEWQVRCDRLESINNKLLQALSAINLSENMRQQAHFDAAKILEEMKNEP